MHGRIWLILGSLICGLAVALGAIGAHWFEGQAKKLYADDALRARRIDNWHDASHYQLTHGLAIIAVGLAAAHCQKRCWTVAGGFFTVGVLLFSGSLCLIALTGAEHLKDLPYGVPLIVATPLGGGCLIAGWVAFLIGAITMKKSP
jgi:uncharacterized membrane protein YgdD (TMEM256/DUF423 family)